MYSRCFAYEEGLKKRSRNKRRIMTPAIRKIAPSSGPRTRNMYAAAGNSTIHSARIGMRAARNMSAASTAMRGIVNAKKTGIEMMLMSTAARKLPTYIPEIMRSVASMNRWDVSVYGYRAVSYTHLRAHETRHDLV